jgi:hypothetical protein
MKKIYLAAVAAVLLGATTLHATLLREQFTNNPALDGWETFGEPTLFAWDSTNHALNVTWDSTRTNSYFYLPLGRAYTQADGFCVLFDLRLADVSATVYGSELAVGLFQFNEATNVNYSRSDGTLPDDWEFDYFPPDQEGDEASLDGTLVDSAGDFFFRYANYLLATNTTYRVVLVHEPGTPDIGGAVFTNGQLMASFSKSYGVGGSFQVDTLAIMNYTDNGFGDVLAHGSVSDLAFASPLPISAIQSLGAGRVQFASDTNWIYQLAGSQNYQAWNAASPAMLGNGTNLVLQATNAPADWSALRVRADLP